MRSLKETKSIVRDVAFSEPANYKNIGIRKDGDKFEFTRRWFKFRNQGTFSTFLPPKFPPNKPLRMIQIGVFEGMDLVWSCQNLLQHHDSRVLTIDPWAETRKLDAEYMAGVEQRARNNLRSWRRKMQIVKGYSADVLQDLIDNPPTIQGHRIPPGGWDLIVIDGDHNADAVYTDAVLSLQLVKPGGWLLFDDVRNRRPKEDHVYDGLIGFLLEHGGEVDLKWYHKHCNCYEKRADD